MQLSDAALQRKRKRAAALSERRSKAARALANSPIGPQSYEASLDGFKGRNKKRLPRHFDQLFSNLRRLVYSRKIVVDDGCVSQTPPGKVLRNTFEILVTLLTICDLKSGQIGKPQVGGMDTTSHERLMELHAIRFGRALTSSTWYRYIDALKRAGIYSVKEVRVEGDVPGTMRSRAAYKWLSQSFLHAIGTAQDNIRASIDLAYRKAVAAGREFHYRVVLRKRENGNQTLPDLFGGMFSPPRYS
ncbi:hypothetical protein [Shewanella sp.]|uniref:hypothetical protein n=1 Tax=Shewanella sp. TaxID=50422 RepID=UPI003D11166A